MKPSIVVLTNLTPGAEHAARYAALLASPLQARLHLLYLYHSPALDPELATITTFPAYRSQAQTLGSLEALARTLPAEAQALVSVDNPYAALEEAEHCYQPLLLVAGLSLEQDVLDRFLHNQLVPALRATRRPVLLVPETAPVAGRPRRVLLAVDAEPFTLNAASRALEPLLDAWPAHFIVTHALGQREAQAYPGQRALAHVRASRLLPPTATPELYEQQQLPPAAGVLQAIQDVQADLLVLIARPRSFLGQLFHRSVTAQVLRRSRVPVLLLPAEAPELPAWLPTLT